MPLTEVIVGHNEALDVPSALRDAVLPSVGRAFALVTTVDSDSEVAAIPSWKPLLDGQAAEYQAIGRGLLVRLADLMRLIDEHDYLSGYDEVWIFRDVPPPKPPGTQITSDKQLETLDPALQAWVDTARPVVGLGDGDGLNFVTHDPVLAAQLSDS